MKLYTPTRWAGWLTVVTLLFPLVLWGLAAQTQSIDPLFLPTPQQVGNKLIILFTQDTLLQDIGASLGRVLVGFLATVVVALPLGIVAGAFPSVAAVVEPLGGLVRYLPASAFVPLLILWLGLGEEPKVALIFLGTVFYTLLLIADAVRGVPLAWVQVSFTLGANSWQILTRVVLPAVLPNILDATRVNLGLAWNLVILAELVAAESGLGYRILRAQRFLETDVMFAGLLCIAVVGIVLDLVLRGVRWWALPWARA